MQDLTFVFVFVFFVFVKKIQKLITYLIDPNKALSKQTTDTTVSQGTRSIFRLTMNELFTLLLKKSFRTKGHSFNFIECKVNTGSLIIKLSF